MTEEEKVKMWQCFETACLMVLPYYRLMTIDEKALWRATARNMFFLCHYPGSMARHPGEWPMFDPNDDYTAPSLTDALK